MRAPRWLAMLWLALSCNGCGVPAGGPLDVFAQGFVYVGSADRNLYLANLSDLNAPWALTDGGTAHTPSLSADGRTVVFVAGDGMDTALCTVPVAGGQVTTVLAATADQQDLGHPVFSPDGTRIAYDFLAGSTSQVGLVSMDGTVAVVVSPAMRSMGRPSFFSGGGQLLVAEALDGGFTQLTQLSIFGGTSQTVASALGSTAQTLGERVVLSPDDLHVAFDAATAQGERRIFVMDLSTQQSAQLTDAPPIPSVANTAPAWQDNATVVYGTTDGGMDEVDALPVSAVGATGVRQLPNGREPWFGPFGP